MSIVLKLSQLGGLVGDLISKIMSSIIEPIVNAVLTFLYSIFVLVWLVISDVLTLFFRKLVGLGSYKVTETNEVVQTDFIYNILMSDAVMNVFWSMIILAVILLFITTFIAVIKSEFASFSDKNANNSKSKIVASAVKSLVNFAIVPICAIVGILIGNALLRTIDGATGGGQETSLGGRVFVASAYGGNRVRKFAFANTQDDYTWQDEGFVKVIVKEEAFNSITGGADYDELTSKQLIEIANKIDERFENPYASGNFAYIFVNIVNVNTYYNLMNFNFLICWITAISICVIMLQIMLGLIKRIFAMVTLFIIAPPIVAMTPIQPEIQKKWNKAFISHVLAAYSSLVAFNIFLIVIKALQNIQFFSEGENQVIKALTFFGWGADLLNKLAYLLIVIGGLVYMKNVTKEVADIIGGDDAYGSGVAATKDFVNKAGKVAGMVATGGAAAGVAVGSVAKGAGKIVGKALYKSGGLGSSMPSGDGGSSPSGGGDSGNAPKDNSPTPTNTTPQTGNNGLGSEVKGTDIKQGIVAEQEGNDKTNTSAETNKADIISENGSAKRELRAIPRALTAPFRKLASTKPVQKLGDLAHTAAEKVSTGVKWVADSKFGQWAGDVGKGFVKNVGTSLKTGVNFAVDPKTAEEFAKGFKSTYKGGKGGATDIIGDLTGSKKAAKEKEKEFNNAVDSALKDRLAQFAAEGKNLTKEEIKGLRASIAETFKNVDKVTKEVAQEEAAIAKGRRGRGLPPAPPLKSTDNIQSPVHTSANNSSKGLDKLGEKVEKLSKVMDKLEKKIDKPNKKK